MFSPSGSVGGTGTGLHAAPPPPASHAHTERTYTQTHRAYNMQQQNRRHGQPMHGSVTGSSYVSRPSPAASSSASAAAASAVVPPLPSPAPQPPSWNLLSSSPDRPVSASGRPTYGLAAYKCKRSIGRGKFGACQLVECVFTSKLYVLKVIPLGELSDAERWFALQEVETLRRLQHPKPHPFIVKYRESFLEHDALNIVMQHASGGDLAQYLRARKSGGYKYLPEHTILDWLTQVLLAIRRCHSLKILHRDIKATNIFLVPNKSWREEEEKVRAETEAAADSTQQQQHQQQQPPSTHSFPPPLTLDSPSSFYSLKLGDFGISKILNSTSELATTQLGTPLSMSPEVVSSQPYSFKSDMWSIGCLLYELCTLKHAFDSNNLLGLVWKIVSESYPPLPDLYSHDLRDLISALLAKDPAARPDVDQILELQFIKDRLKAQIEEKLQARQREARATGTEPIAEELTVPPPSIPAGVSDSSRLSTLRRSHTTTSVRDDTRYADMDPESRSMTTLPSQSSSQSPSHKKGDENEGMFVQAHLPVASFSPPTLSPSHAQQVRDRTHAPDSFPHAGGGVVPTYTSASSSTTRSSSVDPSKHHHSSDEREYATSHRGSVSTAPSRRGSEIMGGMSMGAGMGMSVGMGAGVYPDEDGEEEEEGEEAGAGETAWSGSDGEIETQELLRSVRVGRGRRRATGTGPVTTLGSSRANSRANSRMGRADPLDNVGLIHSFKNHSSKHHAPSANHAHRSSPGLQSRRLQMSSPDSMAVPFNLPLSLSPRGTASASFFSMTTANNPAATAADRDTVLLGMGISSPRHKGKINGEQGGGKSRRASETKSTVHSAFTSPRSSLSANNPSVLSTLPPTRSRAGSHNLHASMRSPHSPRSAGGAGGANLSAVPVADASFASPLPARAGIGSAASADNSPEISSPRTPTSFGQKHTFSSHVQASLGTLSLANKKSSRRHIMNRVATLPASLHRAGKEEEYSAGSSSAGGSAGSERGVRDASVLSCVNGGVRLISATEAKARRAVAQRIARQESFESSDDGQEPQGSYHAHAHESDMDGSMAGPYPSPPLPFDGLSDAAAAALAHTGGGFDEELPPVLDDDDLPSDTEEQLVLEQQQTHLDLVTQEGADSPMYFLSSSDEEGEDAEAEEDAEEDDGEECEDAASSHSDVESADDEVLVESTMTNPLSSFSSASANIHKQRAGSSGRLQVQVGGGETNVSDTSSVRSQYESARSSTSQPQHKRRNAQLSWRGGWGHVSQPSHAYVMPSPSASCSSPSSNAPLAHTFSFVTVGANDAAAPSHRLSPSSSPKVRVPSLRKRYDSVRERCLRTMEPQAYEMVLNFFAAQHALSSPRASGQLPTAPTAPSSPTSGESRHMSAVRQLLRDAGYSDDVSPDVIFSIEQAAALAQCMPRV